MSTASLNNHSTTRELSLMLGQASNLLRPNDNKGQYFNNNSKYQKQTTHTNPIEDYEAMYLNMCKNFRTKIPARKPIPLFSFG